MRLVRFFIHVKIAEKFSNPKRAIAVCIVPTAWCLARPYRRKKVVVETENPAKMMEQCPLCRSNTNHFETGPTGVRYFKCDKCFLLFTHRTALPSFETEKARYETHNNSPNDAGYVSFLNRAVQPTLAYLHADDAVLDYGCGPGPAVEFILQKEGIAVTNYDPIFFPALPNQKFDAVIATECIEHFHQTADEFDKMLRFLKPGGILTLMTDTYEESTDLGTWYYLKDPTHVSLFHHQTFLFVSQKWNLQLLERPERRVYIFRKNNI